MFYSVVSGSIKPNLVCNCTFPISLKSNGIPFVATNTLPIGDLNKDYIKIVRPYLLYFPRNKSSKSIMVESDRFAVVNDTASPIMVTQIYLDFFYRFIELFECRRGDLHMAANRNFALLPRNRTSIAAWIKTPFQRKSE